MTKSITEPPPVSIAAQKLKIYQERADIWCRDKIKIELARYRDRSELERFLAGEPNDKHVWLREQLKLNQRPFDATRSYQAEAFRTMSKPGYYGLPWGNGTAKTCTAALMLLWFLDCWVDGMAITTAGTWSQLKEQLWREIARWSTQVQEHTALVIQHVDKTQIDLGPGWAAFGRAADRPETFEGVHSKNLMVLVDEAKAVKPGIFESIRRIGRGNAEFDAKQNLIHNFWCIFLSSPGSPAGPFYDMVQGDQSHRCTTIHISAYESQRIGLDQINEDIEDLGEDSPLFISMDLGQFPPESEFTLIPLSWIEAALDRPVTDPISNEPAKLQHGLGCDVARFGGDNTAIADMKGRRLSIKHEYSGRDTVFTAGALNDLWLADKHIGIAIDDTGVGGGVTDQLNDWQRPVRGIAFGQTEGLMRPERFANMKSEMYWELRLAFQETFLHYDDPTKGISIPKDQYHKRLIHQLNIQEYKFVGKGLIRMKSHEEMKKDGIKSPDLADALCLAYAAKNHPYCAAQNTSNILDLNLAAHQASRGGNMLTREF